MPQADSPEREALIAQLHDLQTQFEACYRQRRLLAAEVQTLRANMVAEHAARVAAEQAHEALLASTSWRITAPLRAIMGRLR